MLFEKKRLTAGFNILKWLVMILIIVSTFTLSSCSPDPYNLHPQAYKVESAVMGGVALDMQEPRQGSGEYILLEGVPYYDGGIVWKAYYLTDVEITPKVGDAIRHRKSRWGEIFGLLSRGVAGENAQNEIIPRASLSELTEAEKKLMEEENRDREIIISAFAKGKKIVLTEIPAVRRVSAFARYQLLPPGVWVEREPGEWIVKGGRDYRAKVMAREPIELKPVDDVNATQPANNQESEKASEPVLLSPQPRVR